MAKSAPESQGQWHRGYINVLSRAPRFGGLVCCCSEKDFQIRIMAYSGEYGQDKESALSDLDLDNPPHSLRERIRKNKTVVIGSTIVAIAAAVLLVTTLVLISSGKDDTLRSQGAPSLSKALPLNAAAIVHSDYPVCAWSSPALPAFIKPLHYELDLTVRISITYHVVIISSMITFISKDINKVMRNVVTYSKQSNIQSPSAWSDKDTFFPRF